MKVMCSNIIALQQIKYRLCNLQSKFVVLESVNSSVRSVLALKVVLKEPDDLSYIESVLLNVIPFFL